MIRQPGLCHHTEDRNIDDDLLSRCLNDQALGVFALGTVTKQYQIRREKDREGDEYPAILTGIIVLPKDDIRIDADGK